MLVLLGGGSIAAPGGSDAKKGGILPFSGNGGVPNSGGKAGIGNGVSPEVVLA